MTREDKASRHDRLKGMIKDKRKDNRERKKALQVQTKQTKQSQVQAKQSEGISASGVQGV